MGQNHISNDNVYLSPSSQVAAPGAKSAVSDCILLFWAMMIQIRNMLLLNPTPILIWFYTQSPFCLTSLLFRSYSRLIFFRSLKRTIKSNWHRFLPAGPPSHCPSNNIKALSPSNPFLIQQQSLERSNDTLLLWCQYPQSTMLICFQFLFFLINFIF